MKKVIMIVGLIAMLALSACSVPASPDQGAAQNAPVPQEQPYAQPRVISVNGTGQVSLAPDIAYVYIGVHSQSENVSDALAENNTKAQAISQALQGMGIDPKDIQTSSFNIYPQQQYGDQGQVTGTLYNVDNTVYVTVRDLTVLGRLLDEVVTNGANSINGITFDVQDKSQAVSEARRLAIESARAQAEEVAAAAGVGIGGVQSISVYSSSPIMPVYEAKGGMAADAAQVPVSAGQIVLRVEVNVSFLIQ